MYTCMYQRPSEVLLIHQQVPVTSSPGYLDSIVLEVSYGPIWTCVGLAAAQSMHCPVAASARAVPMRLSGITHPTAKAQAAAIRTRRVRDIASELGIATVFLIFVNIVSSSLPIHDCCWRT